MDEAVKKLQDIIDESSRIVFSEEQVCQRRVIYRISEARTDCTGRNINIP
ncbi:hypothetical protein [[Clostridium] hylemonae]